MTIVRKAEIDKIEFNVTGATADQGNIALTWAKLTLDSDAPLAEGTNPIRQVHRRIVLPGEDLATVMAEVNASLAAQGYGTMPSSDVSLVSTISTAVVTKDIKDAFTKREADRAKAAEEAAKAAEADLSA